MLREAQLRMGGDSPLDPLRLVVLGIYYCMMGHTAQTGHSHSTGPSAGPPGGQRPLDRASPAPAPGQTVGFLGVLRRLAPVPAPSLAPWQEGGPRGGWWMGLR